MGHAVPKQHPAVVLRSHFNMVRALLAVAMIAVVGLSAAVVIVANDTDESTGSSAAISQPEVTPLRYDGGPEEGTAVQRAAAPAAGIRYDGGPEEGTAVQRAAAPAAGIRYDGGPEEGIAGIHQSGAGSQGSAETPTGPGFNTD